MPPLMKAEFRGGTPPSAPLVAAKWLYYPWGTLALEASLRWASKPVRIPSFHFFKSEK